MAANQLTQAVRQQLGLGRLLPLGGPADGSWITERAAAGALRAAADALPGVRAGALRLSLADPDAAVAPSVPAPPSALPCGALRIAADFAATADRPLPATAENVRETLLSSAADALGLVVTAVDLRVSALLDDTEESGAQDGEEAAAAGGEGDDEAADPLAAAALGVAGVTRLAPALGALSRPVRAADGHVMVQLAVGADHRALDVALAVRTAVAAAADGPVTVAVLIAAVDGAPGREG